MNDKVFFEEKMELVKEIINKAMTINETTKTNVFVNYFGHIDGLDIYTYKNGWNKDKEMDYNRSNIYIKESEYREKELIIRDLKDISNKLDEYLED